MEDYLDGIGVVQELSWKDQVLHMVVLLKGMDRPISLRAKDISIAPDASHITIHSFESDMPFVEVALNRFATRDFPIPEGKGRLAALAAKKGLGL